MAGIRLEGEEWVIIGGGSSVSSSITSASTMGSVFTSGAICDGGLRGVVSELDVS
jgi:hypothetical protein